MATARAESSREAIVDILRRRDGLSVDELARTLGLAGATVRRHLDGLMRDGYVAVTQVRGGAGRPRYAFSLTPAGADLFPQHYVRMTRRLLDEILALAPDETAGRAGGQLAELVFEKLTARLAQEYAPRITGASLEERARSAASLLADEGLDFEVHPADRGVRVLGRSCPCSRFGAAPHTPCEHGRRLLEGLLGVPAHPLARAGLPPDFTCGYAAGE